MRVSKRICLLVLLLIQPVVFPESPQDLAKSLKDLEALAAKLAKPEGREAALAKLPDAHKNTADPEVKSLILTCYALGHYAAGNDSQAAVVAKRIRAEHAESPNLGFFYAGLYAVPCRACEGVDQILLKCATCLGSGTCTFCNGTASVRRFGGKSMDCHVCKAKPRYCPKCEGRGGHPSACQACPSGYIVSRKRFEEAFVECVSSLATLAKSKGNELRGEEPIPLKPSAFLASGPREVPPPRPPPWATGNQAAMSANQQALAAAGLMGLMFLVGNAILDPNAATLPCWVCHGSGVLGRNELEISKGDLSATFRAENACPMCRGSGKL